MERVRRAEFGGWVLVSKSDGLYFERERLKPRAPRAVPAPRPLRIVLSGPEVAPVGTIVEVEARVLNAEPGVSYVLEARPSVGWIAIIGERAVRVGAGPARFRFVSSVGGRAGLIVEGRRE